MLHNYYLQGGGEDQSFDSEFEMLSRAGLDLLRYTRSNTEIEGLNAAELAVNTLWNRQSYREIKEILRRFRPHILHATNLFPLISPSVFHAARSEGVATVQSLRNYRHFCPSATVFRNGRICRECQSLKVAWPGVVHRCYRGSFLAGSVVAAQQSLHRLLRTWSEGIDCYFAVSEFVKKEHVEAGFPADRIHVKPNSPRADFGAGDGEGGYALYVGRLTEEKGVETVLEAWCASAPMPLKMVGTGPLASLVEGASRECSEIEFLGERPWQEVLELMQGAACVLVPSLWPEPFGRVVVESFSCATPVIAARSGALPGLVECGRTGYLFEPGNCEGLRGSLIRLKNLDSEELSQMRAQARAEFELRYTEASNLASLLKIYEDALEHQKRCVG